MLVQVCSECGAIIGTFDSPPATSCAACKNTSLYELEGQAYEEYVSMLSSMHHATVSC